MVGPERQRSAEIGYRAIEEQVRHIQKQQNLSKIRGVVAAGEQHEDALKCYRRIQVLFQQLQVGRLG